MILQTFENEGVLFEEVLIDKSFPEENSPNRKPKTGLLTAYLDADKYDLENSFVIGDRPTDMELANNLGAKGIYLGSATAPGKTEVSALWDRNIVLQTQSWQAIYEYLKLSHRQIQWQTLFHHPPSCLHSRPSHLWGLSQ